MQIGALLAVAILGTAGHLLLILALGKAPASTLMPFQYVQLAAAALAGYLVFGLAPDGWSWLGMAIIGVRRASAVNVRAAAESGIVPSVRCRRTRWRSERGPWSNLEALARG